MLRSPFLVLIYSDLVADFTTRLFPPTFPSPPTTWGTANVPSYPELSPSVTTEPDSKCYELRALIEIPSLQLKLMASALNLPPPRKSVCTAQSCLRPEECPLHFCQSDLPKLGKRPLCPKLLWFIAMDNMGLNSRKQNQDTPKRKKPHTPPSLNSFHPRKNKPGFVVYIYIIYINIPL